MRRRLLPLPLMPAPSNRIEPMAPTSVSNARIEKAVLDAHEKQKNKHGGKNADYIPILAQVPSTLFGVSVATVDGQVFTAGDAGYEFALESISKIFTLALVIEQRGPRELRLKVGADPTGEAFNSVLALELHNDKPMSPLVNAGAISTTSLVDAVGPEDRWRQIVGAQSDFAGRQISISEEINASEQATNFHNRAIAWLLRGSGYIYCDPMEACDIYTRQCSTLVTTADLAVMGATLANGGTNPITGKRVIARKNVPHVLAEMTMEGVYTRSGDWAYTVGLPAKSGVGGGLVAVAPGQLAIAAFSPPLDKVGNSVRAQAAVAQIADTLQLGLFNVPGEEDE
ncbi:Glutaminase 1 [Mycobacterium marinum]|nr:Glutaminase 1 [Mycobacterium marinum]EPQ70710.1 Glutaminase [Mycobacterium marinum str. Europe]AXN48871.1 Glutaminase 1 [Mycobacterium marinum]RFZ11442.1 Glutaminase 1 [Mycobacterium marinum]RFZ14569.1 Glutaminase 1 [Mycobacterium marinum]